MAGSNNRFSFLHAADLHLDTPFKGVHEVAPAVAKALREASLDAFDAIVELAIEREVAFLVVAGDVYDGAERGLRAQLRFRDGLGRLSAAQIPSFIVHGNHDPVTTGWSAIDGSWPEGVTIFDSDEVRVVPVERNGERIATVQGISFAKQATTENLALRLRRPEGPGLHIGLLHCNLEGGSPVHANYSPCSLEDLRRTGLDYLALGHVHQRQVVRPIGPGRDPWVVYPGNSQARSPRPSETGPKGAVLGHVEHGVVTEVEFVPCDRVRFATVEIEIGGLVDLGELEDRLAEVAREQIDQADGRSVLLRARLVGRGPLHGDLARPGVLAELLDHRRSEHLDPRQFCWWDRILDETAAVIDRAAIRQREDFAADLLALAEELEGDVILRGELARALVGEAPRFFAARLEALISGEDRLEALSRRATNLALDALAADPR